MASQLSRAPLLDERDAQAVQSAAVMSQGVSPSSRYKFQLGAKMDSTTSRFPSSPPNAISHKYWESKQPLQPPEARALAFLRKLDRECCKLTFPEDITFLVDGNEQIYAHRFILVRVLN